MDIVVSAFHYRYHSVPYLRTQPMQTDIERHTWRSYHFPATLKHMSDNILIATSSIADGSMSKGVDDDTKRSNRQNFLKQYDVMLEQSVLVRLEYGSDNYRRYYEVGYEQKGDGMAFGSSITADALFTRTPNIALFLPIADCIAAVFYDSDNRVLGLSHLGRHNLVGQGGSASVQFMQQEFGTTPESLQVWLSAAAGRANYPLHDFENRSLHEVAFEQLAAAGVPAGNISIDTRDTTTDDSLFSHSRFVAGAQRVDGRQAVVCMMRP